MVSRLEEIAQSFDARACGYGRGNWHRRSAERLVELCHFRAGDRVLDAGTGTGFAALAAARAVGDRGCVIGVDVSSGMLREARIAVTQSGPTNVEFVQGDATSLPQLGSGTFDAVTCATGLLYMDAAGALREWHRLLREGGLLAFSTIAAGSPTGGRLFRECAAVFGITLTDPCEALGSSAAGNVALAQAGFEVVAIVPDVVMFSPEDLENAWQSNFRSPAYPEVRQLSREDQSAMERKYLAMLEAEERSRPGALAGADILYAIGRRPWSLV
jgi:ubiquinone/menaquinone biosynthesis C-methylase UbiE